MSDSVRPHRRQPTRLPRPWDSPGKNTGVGCHFLLQCMKVKSASEVALSCPTLSDPMDCSLPGSSAMGFSRQEDWSGVPSPFPISCSTTSLFFCLQSFPASGSFPMSWLFISGGQSIGTSASVLSMNIQGWFPLGLSGLISLLPKGLSRVFSSTTIQKHQFLGCQLSLWSNSHIRTWLLEKQ